MDNGIWGKRGKRSNMFHKRAGDSDTAPPWLRCESSKGALQTKLLQVHMLRHTGGSSKSTDVQPHRSRYLCNHGTVTHVSWTKVPQCDMHIGRSRRHIGRLPNSILLLLLLLATTFTLFTTSLAILTTILISHNQIVVFANYPSPYKITSLSLNLTIILISYPIITLSPRDYY